jgi:ferritin-like metal-binding protein YciE
MPKIVSNPVAPVPVATKKNKTAASNGKIEKQGFTDESIEKLFVEQLKLIYFVEKNLLKTLQKVVKKSSGEVLKNSLIEHKQSTEEHSARIEHAFYLLNKKNQTKKSEAFLGLQDELEEMMDLTLENTVARDMAIITMIQKMEHYEIATYSSIVTMAKIFGFTQLASTLQETLDEEQDTDQQLSYLAVINFNASASKTKRYSQKQLLQ